MNPHGNFNFSSLHNGGGAAAAAATTRGSAGAGTSPSSGAGATSSVSAQSPTTKLALHVNDLPKNYVHIFPFAQASGAKPGKLIFRVRQLTPDVLRLESLENLREMINNVGYFIQGSNLLSSNTPTARLNNTLVVPEATYSTVCREVIKNPQPADGEINKGPYLINTPEMMPDEDLRNFRAEIRYTHIDSTGILNILSDQKGKIDKMFEEDEEEANKFLMTYISEKELEALQAAEQERAQKAREEENRKAALPPAQVAANPVQVAPNQALPARAPHPAPAVPNAAQIYNDPQGQQPYGQDPNCCTIL